MSRGNSDAREADTMEAIENALPGQLAQTIQRLNGLVPARELAFEVRGRLLERANPLSAALARPSCHRHRDPALRTALRARVIRAHASAVVEICRRRGAVLGGGATGLVLALTDCAS